MKTRSKESKKQPLPPLHLAIQILLFQSIDSNDSIVKGKLRIVGEANVVTINEPVENEILTENSFK